ncbi:hypothetical protein [Actinomarinicola tropica]|uniref:Uncharacterized protein n=1 Tax=Actinomarinicola tropica TaxID=2789776 RepID=A0A5Q2RMD8_9ACTN|nr:hypothetical protein [Actinomarinicola tropica]QGG95721.1 hypothetical protein GH723_11780 [Actinomarinicola tropica]
MTRRVVDPSRWVSLAVGLVVLLGGAVAVVRVGIGRFPSGPAVDVWGLRFTPLLAVVVLLLGAFFCVAAADPSRAASTFTATFGILGGLAVALIDDDLPAQMLSTPRLGWTCVGLSAVVLVSDLTLPALAVGRPRRRRARPPAGDGHLTRR